MEATIPKHCSTEFLHERVMGSGQMDASSTALGYEPGDHEENIMTNRTRSIET